MIPLEDMPLLLLCSVRVAPRTLFLCQDQKPLRYTAPCATPFTGHRVTVLHRALRYTAHRSPFTSSPCYTAPLRYTAHRSPSTVHCVTVLHRALRYTAHRSPFTVHRITVLHRAPAQATETLMSSSEPPLPDGPDKGRCRYYTGITAALDNKPHLHFHKNLQARALFGRPATQPCFPPIPI